MEDCPNEARRSFAGLRLPATLEDPANWQAAHRLTGLLGCVVLPILIGVAYSLHYASKARS